MSKKILSVILAAMMLFAVLTGCASSCKKNPEKKPSSSTDSKIESSLVDDGVSSGIAGEDTESGSSHPYKWQIQTTSTTFRDDPAAQVSATTSTSIKHWKDPDSVQLGCYHLQLRLCDDYGTDIQSRLREFQEVVDLKYFNTYILDSDMTYLQLELPIIAKAGATFWIGFGNYHSSNETIESYTERIRPVIDYIRKNGYGDIFNGVIWDEPALNAQAGEDFLKQCEVHYKVFGLRNNPVFAVYAFNEVDAKRDGQSEVYGRIKSEHCKYVTDVGFDVYSVDVRDGVVFSDSTLNSWKNSLGTTVVDGKDYYTKRREEVLKFIGHDANWWHFPCAYENPITTGGVADEEYCMAHLEYLVQDVLASEYPGGVFVYTYQTWLETHGRIALDARIPIKDEFGHYTHSPEQGKWDDYFAFLQKTREMLDSKKQKLVDLGL